MTEENLISTDAVKVPDVDIMEKALKTENELLVAVTALEREHFAEIDERLSHRSDESLKQRDKHLQRIALNGPDSKKPLHEALVIIHRRRANILSMYDQLGAVRREFDAEAGGKTTVGAEQVTLLERSLFLQQEYLAIKKVAFATIRDLREQVALHDETPGHKIIDSISQMPERAILLLTKALGMEWEETKPLLTTHEMNLVYLSEEETRLKILEQKINELEELIIGTDGEWRPESVEPEI